MQHFRFPILALVALRLISASWAAPTSNNPNPESLDLKQRSPVDVPTPGANNQAYPPEGVDYTIPRSPYRLHYFTVPRGPASVTLPLSAIDSASTHGAQIYTYLTQQFGMSTSINFQKDGALGGKIDHDGVSIHIRKVLDAYPTYEDALWIMKGVGGAARDKGCLESARIVVWKGGAWGMKEKVIAHVEFGKEKEGGVEVS